MGPARALMFHRLAEYYDPLYAWKDYRGESKYLESLARRYGRSGGTKWLDVACGTGRHLEFLRRRFSVRGIDASPEMLRFARRRLPGIRLGRADMRTFRLAESFDVVSCLFSAIGHLATERDLQLAVSNFARHLKPGGVAIVEPWVQPADFRAGSTHLLTHQGPTTTIVRLASSARRGNISIVRYHYLIGETGRPVRYFEDVSRGLMVPRTRLLTMMRTAGLRPRSLARGLMKRRGLLVGVKPLGPRTSRRRAASMGRAARRPRHGASRSAR
jgi:ubiquinone/menaquinone biosynthesis C-methylase UbiE